MKFGDVTIKQIEEICKDNLCGSGCPFYTQLRCLFNGKTAPSEWDFDMEVNTNAKN